MYISQPCAHPCARKPRLRPRSGQFFWNFPLYGVDKNARSARGSARTLFSIWNLNSHENLDAFWSLDHYISSKSEETGFMWIWCIFKKFQFWNFFKILKIWKNLDFLTGPRAGAQFPRAGMRAQLWHAHHIGFFDKNGWFLSTWTLS